jgi:hypothetical protein
VDTGEKISREFVIACRDGAKVLEFVEEALDEITLAIQSKIAGQWARAAGVGRNHRSDLSLGEGLDEGVGIVCLVGNERPWIGMLEQRLAAGEIVVLARGENELDGIAESIDECMNFCAQSAATSPDRLRAVFFLAPALCW